MILLDTNIISELMSADPSKSVIAWFAAHEGQDFFISSVSVAEISYGLHILPQGKRRESLEVIFKKAVIEFFRYRVLAFDERAAHCYGKLMALRKKAGRPLDVAGAQIAAIADAHGFILATRNVRDFKYSELQLINPFEYS